MPIRYTKTKSEFHHSSGRLDQSPKAQSPSLAGSRHKLLDTCVCWICATLASFASCSFHHWAFRCFMSCSFWFSSRLLSSCFRTSSRRSCSLGVGYRALLSQTGSSVGESQKALPMSIIFVRFKKTTVVKNETSELKSRGGHSDRRSLYRGSLGKGARSCTQSGQRRADRWGKKWAL